MLDHLEVHHNVDRPVGQRKLRQVAVAHVHPRVVRAHVGHRCVVVVQPDHGAGDVGDQVSAISLAASGLQHVATRAPVTQPLVDHLVAAEPVILLGQAGNRALPGQR